MKLADLIDRLIEIQNQLDGNPRVVMAIDTEQYPITDIKFWESNITIDAAILLQVGYHAEPK